MLCLRSLTQCIAHGQYFREADLRRMPQLRSRDAALASQAKFRSAASAKSSSSRAKRQPDIAASHSTQHVVSAVSHQAITLSLLRSIATVCCNQSVTIGPSYCSQSVAISAVVSVSHACNAIHNPHQLLSRAHLVYHPPSRFQREIMPHVIHKCLNLSAIVQLHDSEKPINYTV